MKKILSFIFSTFLALVFSSQSNHVVNTVNNSFSPSIITVDVGDTVTWVNGGGTHNVNGNQSTFSNNPSSFGNSLRKWLDLLSCFYNSWHLQLSM